MYLCSFVLCVRMALGYSLLFALLPLSTGWSFFFFILCLPWSYMKNLTHSLLKCQQFALHFLRMRIVSFCVWLLWLSPWPTFEHPYLSKNHSIMLNTGNSSTHGNTAGHVFLRKLTPFCLWVVFMWLHCKHGNVWHPLVSLGGDIVTKVAPPLKYFFRIFSLWRSEFELSSVFFSGILQSCLGRKQKMSKPFIFCPINFRKISRLRIS